MLALRRHGPHAAHRRHFFNAHADTARGADGGGVRLPGPRSHQLVRHRRARRDTQAGHRPAERGDRQGATAARGHGDARAARPHTDADDAGGVRQISARGDGEQRQDHPRAEDQARVRTGLGIRDLGLETGGTGIEVGRF